MNVITILRITLIACIMCMIMQTTDIPPNKIVLRRYHEKHDSNNELENIRTGRTYNIDTSKRKCDNEENKYVDILCRELDSYKIEPGFPARYLCSLYRSYTIRQESRWNSQKSEILKSVIRTRVTHSDHKQFIDATKNVNLRPL